MSTLYLSNLISYPVLYNVFVTNNRTDNIKIHIKSCVKYLIHSPIEKNILWNIDGFSMQVKGHFLLNTRMNCYTRSVDKIIAKIHSFKIIGVCQFIDMYMYMNIWEDKTQTLDKTKNEIHLFLFKSVTMIMADIKKLTIMTLQHGDKICDCNTCEPYSSSVHLHVLSCLPLLSL